MTKAHSLDRFARDERGTIAICSAAALGFAIGASALAVDLASLYLERRTAQGVADLAAMNAATYPDRPEWAASGTISANRLTNVKDLVVTKGRYEPDPSTPAAERFRAGVLPTNAVRVSIARSGTLFFANAFMTEAPELRVSATAAIASSATYSIGSRLAAVRDGALNNVLGALLGGQVQLSVMDYNALMSATVRVDSFLNAIAVESQSTAVTYDQLLKSDTKVSTLLGALRASLNDKSGPAASALSLLSNQVLGSSRKFGLGKLLDIGTYGALSVGQAHPGLDANLRAFDIVKAAGFLANGSSQVGVDLQLNIPGVARSTLKLAIGEPMQYSTWAAVGQSGSIVRTAQLKLLITNEIGGTGLLAGATLRLPIYAEAAYADAKLTAVTCTEAGNGTATVGATPGVARVAIADVTSSMLASPTLWLNLPQAKIVDTGLAVVSGKAEASVGNQSATNLTFDASDVRAGTIKRTDTNSYVASLVTSLIGKLQLQAQVAGLGLTLPGQLTSAVATQLGAVASPLDAAIHSLLTALGVHVGEADVVMHGIRCGGAALVD